MRATGTVAMIYEWVTRCVPSSSMANTRPCEPRRRSHAPTSYRCLTQVFTRRSCALGDGGSSERAGMSNLLFLRRSYAYRHAAATAFRNARALPIGSERNVQRVLARGLRELAETEAWLEGQRSRRPEFLRAPISPAWEPDRRRSID
jgi:hypothetical protein